MTSEVMLSAMCSGHTRRMQRTFGSLLREHRERRRLSQGALAEHAEVSTRHLSFLENAKASPSREMILVLASALELPLRERNVLLGAAGFAPVYRETALDAEALSQVRQAVELILSHHDPLPAIVVDPLWNIVRANVGAGRLVGAFLEPNASSARIAGNGMRLLFHPEGLRPWIENWDEVAAYALEVLTREARGSSLEGGEALVSEILGYVAAYPLKAPRAPTTPVLEVRLRKGELSLRYFTTLTSLTTPLDITAQELRIESYFPADQPTRDWTGRAGSSGPAP